MSIELDELDKLAASVFDGYLVRKDLVRKYSRQYPVPTYVVEFLLGRYCASVNESEIAEGLEIVEKQLKDRTVRTGEEAVSATITEISWRGMRCRVAVKSSAPGLQVDLRLNWKQAATSIVAAAKELGTNGEASLAVSDDKHEGAAASVVVSDTSGRVLDSKPTTVGEDA